MQVPPGHMVQQILDQNGTLQHVILSLDPNSQAAAVAAAGPTPPGQPAAAQPPQMPPGSQQCSSTAIPPPAPPPHHAVAAFGPAAAVTAPLPTPYVSPSRLVRQRVVLVMFIKQPYVMIW